MWLGSTCSFAHLKCCHHCQAVFTGTKCQLSHELRCLDGWVLNVRVCRIHFSSSEAWRLQGPHADISATTHRWRADAGRAKRGRKQQKTKRNIQEKTKKKQKTKRAKLKQGSKPAKKARTKKQNWDYDLGPAAT